MNLSLIKDWFANVDISHTDWRVRWPLIILPFLLVALVYFLLRANQLAGVQADAALDLQKLVQAGGVVPSRSVVSDDSSRALSAFNLGMAELELNAGTLRQWLQQGRNTEALTEWATELLDLSISTRGIGQLPDATYWGQFSDVLAVLESAVIEGQVKTPEARDLIFQIRSQYAELRALQDDEIAGGSSAAQNPVNTVTSTAVDGPDWQVISGELTRLREQRTAITTLQNRALIVAALCSGLFALLLWGLWHGAQHRQRKSAGRVRHEQSAILRLLDEISPLAQGDLRVKATVSEASTGAVADAFNFAVEELRRLVTAVTASADLVNSSVHETRESAFQLAKASSVQAREIHRSSNYLNVMSDTMAQLSEHAVESSRIADLSVRQARAGNSAVQENVDGLQRIREQAEMTSRLMQRLVETSSAINERVTDIQAVAKRTDLLALNATIQSSAQVSNGVSENISMLSDDIAHLADTLGRASRDITSLSDLIQQDAIITLKSMASTVTELDDGQRTALQASDSLNEIERVSNELNGLISDIASKSLRQAGVVKQLSANMGVINNITRDSTMELQDSAKALENLRQMTSELRDSVSDFKLPRAASAFPGLPKRQLPAPAKVAQPSSKVARSKISSSKVARSPVKHA